MKSAVDLIKSSWTACRKDHGVSATAAMHNRHTYTRVLLKSYERRTISPKRVPGIVTELRSSRKPVVKRSCYREQGEQHNNQRHTQTGGTAIKHLCDFARGALSMAVLKVV